MAAPELRNLSPAHVAVQSRRVVTMTYLAGTLHLRRFGLDVRPPRPVEVLAAVVVLDDTNDGRMVTTLSHVDTTTDRRVDAAMLDLPSRVALERAAQAATINR